MRKQIKPPTRYKHLGRGNKYACKLLTQICVGNFFLKSDSFKTGHSDNNVCFWGQIEDSKHYFTKCNLYTAQIQNLIRKMEQFIPKFRLLAAKRQLEIITMGYEYSNAEMIKVNTKIMVISQNDILQTKRFVK